MSNRFIYVTASMCVLSMLLCCFTGMGIMLCEQRQQALNLEIEQVKGDIALLSAVIQKHDEIMVTYQFFNEHWDAILRESLKRGETYNTQD